MRIVIVGGGAAGWISAGFLVRALNQLRPTAELTLIESPDVRRIGVGEATFPTLRRTLQQLGISEREFLRRTQATFKQGVRFVDWAQSGHFYYHPFEALLQQTGGEVGERWLARMAAGEARPFAYDFGVQVYAADARRSPKLVSDPEYAGMLNYAYHVDADLLGDYLAERMTAAGVRHLRDEVVDVQLDADSGDIAALRTRSGERVEGDFFVDCTGFASVLLGKAMGVGFRSYRDHLLCDRAVAMRLPYAQPGVEIDPFTTARALGSGWMWKVGLQERAGVGYVYSSEFLSDDAAEAELRRSVGAPADASARLLRIRTGRSEVAWERNCAAIGLAGGFIEPLESTGILLIEESARMLAASIPLKGEREAVRRAYNRFVAELYEEIRDFIVLHYCVSQRRDTPFWREVVRDERIPDRVQELLALWRERPPADEDLATRHAFPALSYQYVLYGMDWTPTEAIARAALRRPQSPPPQLEQKRAEMLRLLPRHREAVQALATAG